MLEPYLDAIGPFDEAEGRPLSYPGSPALAQALLRAQDRLALCEAHPQEQAALVAAIGRDRRVSVIGGDGYVALNAAVPPKERRGLVLIDPPFEEPQESRAGRGGARAALCANGRAEPTSYGGRSRTSARTRISATRSRRSARPICCGSRSTSARLRPARIRHRRLHRAGLIVVNPPFGLIEEARALMPWLAKLLTRAGKGAHVVEWLTPPL